MELFFLGTGAGLPSKQRNVSALALTMYDERSSMWLFDCGEATQHQIIRSPLRLTKLEFIFVSHLHGDHIFGLPGLIASRSAQGATSGLTVFGPKGIQTFIDTSLRVSHSSLQFPLHVKEISEGVVYADSQITVTAKLLQHGVPSFGYRLIEKDQPGTFFPEKAKQAGVPPGPLFAKLKRGETITLESGLQVNGKQFVGPAIIGRKICILGDTKPCQAAIELARDADVVVHEATFSKAEESLAGKYHHSTAGQAARIASEAGAKRLVLTHISSRFHSEGEALLLEEARAIFPETVLASDFESFPIPYRKS